MPIAIAAVASKSARGAAALPPVKPAAAASARAADRRVVSSLAPPTAKSAGNAAAPLYNARGVLAVAKPVGAAATSTVSADGTGGGFVTRGGQVSVDILNSDSGYENKIYWSADNFATRHLLGVDNQTGTVALGEFAAGTKIEFGIVNGANQFFRTGGAGANPDGVDHTRSSSSQQGQVIGFEDLSGGGDRDFNDAIIRVREQPPGAASHAERVGGPPKAPSVLATLPPAVVVDKWPTPQAGMAPRSTVSPAATAGQPTTANGAGRGPSRSGLGDGSNPGHGAGRTNSPNTGTLNPNQAPTRAPALVVASTIKGKAAQLAAATAHAPALHPATAAVKRAAAATPSKASPLAVAPSQPQGKETSTKQLLVSSYVSPALGTTSSSATASQRQAEAKSAAKVDADRKF